MKDEMEVRYMSTQSSGDPTARYCSLLITSNHASESENAIGNIDGVCLELRIESLSAEANGSGSQLDTTWGKLNRLSYNLYSHFPPYFL